MRSLLALLLLAPVAVAQTAEEKKATLAFIESLRDKDTGAFKVTPDGKPSLRACNGAAKAIKVLGGELADKDKVSKFVLGCYDEKAGTFADPGTKADVASTAIGVIVACELGIPKDKFKGAMDYLGKNAKEFEDVRIAAAAVEAWGVKDCPFELDTFVKAGLGKFREAVLSVKGRFLGNEAKLARDFGGSIAMLKRISSPAAILDADQIIQRGQLADGGWGKSDAKVSDIETTYRVMRALMLLKAPPKDEKKLREFLAAHRNKDGGSATEPGKASSMSGVYYNAIITKWLDEMGKK
jgi:prenyltransferase beta subunit